MVIPAPVLIFLGRVKLLFALFIQVVIGVADADDVRKAAVLADADGSGNILFQAPLPLNRPSAVVGNILHLQADAFRVDAGVEPRDHVFVDIAVGQFIAAVYPGGDFHTLHS